MTLRWVALVGSLGSCSDRLDRVQTLARTILSPAALAYYESGSDDESSEPSGLYDCMSDQD